MKKITLSEVQFGSGFFPRQAQVGKSDILVWRSVGIFYLLGDCLLIS